MLQTVVFIALSALVVIPAILVVVVRNIFHAALWLVLSLTATGGLFAMMGADFLFAVQILLYAGGITVLLMFVVLLSGSPRDWIVQAVGGLWPVALILSALYIWLLVAVFQALPAGAPVEALPTTAALGDLLLKDMALPFEVISLLLLAALVGAVFFSRRRDEL